MLTTDIRYNKKGLIMESSDNRLDEINMMLEPDDGR
jgi:hypothetical protein